MATRNTSSGPHNGPQRVRERFSIAVRAKQPVQWTSILGKERRIVPCDETASRYISGMSVHTKVNGRVTKSSMFLQSGKGIHQSHYSTWVKFPLQMSMYSWKLCLLMSETRTFSYRCEFSVRWNVTLCSWTTHQKFKKVCLFLELKNPGRRSSRNS